MRRCALILCDATADVSNILFAERREKILSDLAANRNDKSLAGCVDPLVAPLVSLINGRFRCYVTSSSCSGRVSLFHKGHSAALAPAHRKRGSFGRGALFQSHDALTCAAALRDALNEFAAWRAQLPSDDDTVRATEVLQLKFEPVIVHVQCMTVEDAARLLQCASESGQMTSGVISCSRGTAEQRKITCCITSPMNVDMPLFSQGKWLLGHARFDNDEWDALLTNSVSYINGLFAENEARRRRFTQEIETRLL